MKIITMENYKKLYYTKSYQLDDIDGFKETNGWKDITVYSIQKNIPTKEFDLEVLNTDSSKEAIQQYLDDNGMGDDSFEFIEL